MISNLLQIYGANKFYIFILIYFLNLLFTVGTSTCAKGYAPFNLFPSRESSTSTRRKEVALHFPQG